MAGDRQSEDRRRIGQHLTDPLERQLRVDGQVGAAGLGDRPDPEDGFDGTRNRQCYIGLRPHAPIDQDARQLIRPLVEFPVRDLTSLEGHRDRLRGDLDTRTQQFGQCARLDRLRSADRGDRGLLHGVEDLDVAEDHVAVGRHGIEDPAEPVREAQNGLLVEDVGRVVERRGDTRGGPVDIALADAELEVEFGDLERGVERGDLETRELHPDRFVVVERQRHLEQRLVRRRPRDVEYLDETLERNVAVAERIQIGGAHLRQQVGEGVVGTHRRAEHEGVDEHADEPVQFLLAAAGDRGADRDVRLRRQPLEQDGQRGVHDHEQGRVRFPGDREQPAVGLRVDREPCRRTAQRLHGRPGPVGRQLEHLGEPAERLLPVAELAGDQRFGVGLVTERLTLPQRVVGVLDGQRFPPGSSAGRTRRVGGHDVGEQGRQRRTVGRDVVHDHHQDVVGGVHLEAGDPHRHRLGDVESGGAEFTQPRVQVLLVGDRGRGQVGHHVGCGQHDLVRVLVADREDRPQRLVPLDDVRPRRIQRRRIDRAGQPHRQRQVVRRGGRIELVDEPHPLLRQRQRDAVGAGTCDECGTVFGGSRGRFEQRSEFCDGRMLEALPDRQVRAERGGQPGGEPRCADGVSAEVEERVGGTDAFDAEHLAEHPGDDLLDRGTGDDVFGLGRDEVRFGKCTPVQLAGGAERETVQDEDPGGHHVRGQRLRCRVQHRRGVDRRIGHRDHVAHQVLAGGLAAVHDDHGLRHRRVRQKCGLDLAELEPLSAELDLEVAAPDVLDDAVGALADDVAGAIHPLPGRAERVRHEPVGRQVAAADVAAGQLDAGEVQLAVHTRGDGTQPGVEDVQLRVPHGRADRHRRAVRFGALPVGDVDRGLRRAVQVVQRCGREVPERGRGGRRKGFTTAEHLTQRTAQRGVRTCGEHRQHGRHEVHRGHAVPGDDLGEVHRVAVPVRDRDDELGSDLERPEQFPHGHVERDRSLLQDDVRGIHRVGVLHPQQPVDDRPVTDGDALRLTGRSGRVDHVGGRIRTDRCPALVIGDRTVGVTGEVDGVHLDPRRGRLCIPIGRRGQHADRGGAVDHVRGARRRMIRVERHVGGARLLDRVDRDHHLEGAAQRDRDPGLRADTPCQQFPCQSVGPGVELGIRQRVVAEHQGNRVRRPRHLLVEQVDEGALLRRGRGGRRRRVGDHAGEDTGERIREAFTRRAVEQSG
nr:hypothetical protein GCM10017611_84490 [Rhodococcus wratislaviensis]